MTETSPWHISPYAHLVDLAKPSSEDVIAFARDVEKVRAILATHALDDFPEPERVQVAWKILQQREALH